MKPTTSLSSTFAERSIWDSAKRNRYRIENAAGTACVWASSIDEAEADLARTPGGKLVDEWQERPYTKPVKQEQQSGGNGA